MGILGMIFNQLTGNNSYARDCDSRFHLYSYEGIKKCLDEIVSSTGEPKKLFSATGYEKGLTDYIREHRSNESFRSEVYKAISYCEDSSWKNSYYDHLNSIMKNALD